MSARRTDRAPDVQGEDHGDPEEQNDEGQEQTARCALESETADVRELSAVSPAEAATPRLCELRVLRRSAGGRGRGVGVGRPGLGRKRSPLEEALGVEFQDRELLEAALTHRSYAFEHGGPVTNERLEFLGDAVLGVVVTDLAYRSFPNMAEGELAKLRAATVNMATLAAVAKEIGLGDALLLGRGEELSGGRAKASILADAFEAVLGAIYLDVGHDAAAAIIRRVLWPRMEAYVRGEGDRDYKTGLQELAAQDLGGVPEYRVDEDGPDHQKVFTARVYLDGREFGAGTGRSKKEAEQLAAKEAFDRLTASAAASGERGRAGRQ